MDKNNIQEFESDLKAFAQKWGATKIIVETYDFERDYRGDIPSNLQLRTEKAIVRVLGRVQKTFIGADRKYKTHEEATEGVKAYWSNYFKERRANWTDKEREQARKRQQRYRDRQKREREALRRRQ